MQICQSRDPSWLWALHECQRGDAASLTWLPFWGGVGRSSPPNVKKKNKVSLCSACFNNFHKFSSEIKKLPSGRKREEERDRWRFRGEGGKSPRETAPLRCQVWLKCTGSESVCRGDGWGQKEWRSYDEWMNACLRRCGAQPFFRLCECLVAQSCPTLQPRGL